MSELVQEERPWARGRTPSPYRAPDAGVRGLDHYEHRLPRWRYDLRQKLIPLVRWETNCLARLQTACRSPFLDSYFALTANLGTHTFFMAALPICFWFGHTKTGKALVQMLAAGVYLSGFVKDMVCLPRPLSPPLQRITMSGSAALEYGFPSTHTTNAVSVAIYCLHGLHSTQSSFSPAVYNTLNNACYAYAISISVGRMYCGMHGFMDVLIGGLLGAFIAWARIAYGDQFDVWVLEGSWQRLALIVVVLLLAIRFHPEPADNCPCFDDSVAFAGVVMGVEAGIWHYQTSTDMPAAVPQAHELTSISVARAVSKVVGGVIIIFCWRALAKPILLRYLPPIFRAVEHVGIAIPRRYFVQARDYRQVPPLRKDDKVLPSAAEISGMLSSLRNPRKGSVSVGPQSEADAREFIASREQRRKNSEAAQHTPAGFDDGAKQRVQQQASSAAAAEDATIPRKSAVSSSSTSPPDTVALHAGQRVSQLIPQARMLHDLLTPPSSERSISTDSGREEEKKDRQMFSTLERPRIRYDVEVITKLVVYAGIAWLAVEGNPSLFEALHL